MEAQVRYLDAPPLTPTEKFLLFDDGLLTHGDTVTHDRLFNALWLPRYGGQIELTVTATLPDGRQDFDVITFNITALPDLAVTAVNIKDAGLVSGTHVEAVITNLGFAVEEPIDVIFVYYRTDDNGNRIGSSIWTSPVFQITGGLVRGQSESIEDNSFNPGEAGTYYVDVIVDP